VASIFAVRALHAGGVFQQLSAKRTAHDVVKLLLHELVAVHLVHLFFLCTDSAFSSQAEIQRLFVVVELHCEASESHENTKQGTLRTEVH
jgi:hypothetical protein